MGLISWIIIAVAVLALIGVGIGSFTSGVFEGAKVVAGSPIITNATGEAQEYAGDLIANATRDALP
jgi:hypothetical protein